MKYENVGPSHKNPSINDGMSTGEYLATTSHVKAIVAVLDDALPMLIQQNPSAFDGISEKLAPLDGLLSDE